MTKFETLQRYQLIEVLLQWEGEFCSNHLCEYFGLGRPQVSKIVKTYQKDISDTNFTYCNTRKRHLASATFTPYLTQGKVDEYLDFVQRLSAHNKTAAHNVFCLPNAEFLPMPRFAIEPEIFKGINRAIANNLRIDVDYRSVNAPNKDGRIIVPHAIAHSGVRWHVRAYCEKNQDFRDFVLTRFVGEVIEEGPAKIDSTEDINWHTMVDVVIVPHPYLTEAQQAVVARDYGMTDGQRVLTVRASLLTYLLKMLQLNLTDDIPDATQGETEGEALSDEDKQQIGKAKQVMVANREALQKWGF